MSANTGNRKWNQWPLSLLAALPLFFAGCAQVTTVPAEKETALSGANSPGIESSVSDESGAKLLQTGSYREAETAGAGQDGYAKLTKETGSASSLSRSVQSGIKADPSVMDVSAPGPGTVEFINPMDEASHLNLQIHDIATQILENFNGEIAAGYPIAVATFVDLNDLYRTCPYGRYVAEQLMGELQRAGFHVVELRRTDSIMIKEKYGEYGLSRQVREIARRSNANYVLVGTYVTRGGYLFTNARLISSADNMVVSSALKIMRRDHLIDRMLWPSSAPARNTGRVKRVPIKAWDQLHDVEVLSSMEK